MSILEVTNQNLINNYTRQLFLHIQTNLNSRFCFIICNCPTVDHQNFGINLNWKTRKKKR